MKYFYLKSINNNAISAMDEHHHEVIILGKAIGIKCNRTIHSLVDKQLIERKKIYKRNLKTCCIYRF